MEISMSGINYYEQFFRLLSDIKYMSDETTDEIETYNNYFYKGKWKTLISIFVMVITGLVIPLAGLFSNILLLPLETVEIVAGLGFGLSTAIAIYLIYRDVSKF